MTINPPKLNWRESELQVWKPKDNLLISEWMQRYYVLGSQSEEQGPINLDRTPYLRRIVDTCLEPYVETVVFCSSAQIGKTTAMIGIGGYFAHQEPCPIYLIMADESTAEFMGRERVQKLFDDSQDLMALKGSLWKKNELELINGAYWAVGYASSVTKLGSKSFRILLLDEVDKPGYYITSKEASPLSLAQERKETFFNFLLFLTSTPTLETGNITVELESCDVIYDFHVPCPKCKQRQPMRYSRKYATGFKKGLYRDEKGKRRRLGEVVWQGGRDATQKQIDAAKYKCGNCGKMWSTIQKNNAVQKGRWISRAPVKGTPKKIGFHLNRLYSLLGKSGDLGKLAGEFVKCIKSGDPKKLQGFVNSTLAEPWKETIVKVDESKVLEAKCGLPPQVVPREAVALTCGIDVQKRGFWFVVRAWARDYVSWLIHYGFLGSWQDLERLLFETQYPVDDNTNRTMPIWRAAIDTGGGEGFEDMATMTEQTYFWIRKNGIGRGCRIWGTKGASNPVPGKIRPGSVIDKTPSGKPLVGGLQLIMLDPNELKDMYHYRLDQAKSQGEQSGYLHSKVGMDYARQVTAEEKRIDEKGAQVWVEIRRDNHLLDAECLAQACAEPNWPGGGVNLWVHRDEIKKETGETNNGSDWIKPGTSRGGGWLNRG